MRMRKLKQKAAWALIGAMVFSNVGQAFAAAGWNQDSRGWTYENEAGSKVAGGWVLDGTLWYHMNAEGYMDTGWYTDVDGRKYYLDPNVGGPQGSMKTGWVLDPATARWYYFNPSAGGPQGSMMTGWVTADGKRWFLNGDGSWDGKEGIAVSSSRGGGGGGSSSGGSGGSGGGSGTEKPITPDTPDTPDTPEEPTIDTKNLRVGDAGHTYGWTYDEALNSYGVEPGTYDTITVTAAVGNDTVTIADTNVTGLIVQGGGSNSIILRDTTAAEIILDKNSNDTRSQSPRLLLAGESSATAIKVVQPAILESRSGSDAVGTVTTENKLTIQGSTTSLNTVVASGNQALVNINEGKVAEMTLENGAEAAASAGGSADVVKVSGAVTLNNLPVNQGVVAENGSATVTMEGATSIPIVTTTVETTLKSKGDAARIAVVNTSASLIVENTAVNLVETSGDNTTITMDETASLNAVSMNSGTLNIAATGENESVTVGKVVANGGATLDVGTSVTVTEVEARGDVEIKGDGAVIAVAAEENTTISGTVGEAASQMKVKFLTESDIPQLLQRVEYGATEFSELKIEYTIDGVDGVAIADWPEYTFTSKTPGAYTVVGTWASLPYGVRAGNVNPIAKIIVEEPDTVNLTFTESAGLKGYELTLTSTDGGEVISETNTAATVVKGKTYTYTISMDGYEAITGTIRADANQNIPITLKATTVTYSLRFAVPGDWSTYTEVAQPTSGSYISGTKIVLPKAHTKTGYNLVWTDNAGNTVSEVVASANAEYTAQWEIIHYPIKYVLNGGTLDAPKKEYTVEDSYSIPTPTHPDNLIFAGWYTTASFAGQEATGIKKGSTGTKTFYARWMKDMSHLLEQGVAVTSDVASEKVLNNVLFAEGAPVVVNSYSQDKLWVTWNDGQYLAPVGMNIYAGSYTGAYQPNVTVEADSKATITVNGGSVGMIFGGGAGGTTFEEDAAANVTGNVVITVKGGTVDDIYGGGTGQSAVDGIVTIDVQKTDKAIHNIYGGGAAPHGSMANLTGKKSKNHVEEVNIHVAEGVTVHALTGGGISISSVGISRIELNGTVKARMIAAGTNGYVGKTDVTLGATAHLEAGNAYSDYPEYEGMLIYQAGIRGEIMEVNLLVKAGAQIDGDIYLGTNSLYKDGQTAKITGDMHATFEEGFTCDGVVYLGMGSNGDSLSEDNDIVISGPVKVSKMMYSQAFNSTTLDMIPQNIIDRVQGFMKDGAAWADGFAGGTGTEEDPFVIETDNQFKLMYSNAEYAAGGYSFKLATDIELNENDATYEKYAFGRDFSGTIDGDGHTISYDGKHGRALFYYVGADASKRDREVTFKNINLHMKGEGVLLLALAVYSNSICFDTVNTTGAGTVTIGTNESAYMSQAASTVDRISFKNCISSINYNMTHYAAVFIGGYIAEKTDGSQTEISFTGCVNNGNLSGCNPAVFIGNSNRTTTIDVKIEDTYQNGNVVGTETAGLFAQNVKNECLAAYNEAFKSIVKGSGKISVSQAEDLALGLNNTTQEYYIEDTSAATYASYVLSLEAYAREANKGTFLISINKTFAPEDLNASDSNWRSTDVYAGTFMNRGSFVQGVDDENIVETGTTDVGTAELTYTVYQVEGNEKTVYYYVFEDEELELFGMTLDFTSNGTPATANLYGVDADGMMYGPINKLETITEPAANRLLAATPSNATLFSNTALTNTTEEADAEDDLEQNEKPDDSQNDTSNNTDEVENAPIEGQEEAEKEVTVEEDGVKVDEAKEDNTETNSDPEPQEAAQTEEPVEGKEEEPEEEVKPEDNKDEVDKEDEAAISDEKPEAVKPEEAEGIEEDV